MARRKVDDSSEPIERLSWLEFYDWWRWGSDQSVSIVGGIGSGKTTLELAILPKQSSVVFLGTKPRDRMYSILVEQGYREITHWPRPTPMTKYPNPGPRILLRPPVQNLEADVAKRRAVFRDALGQIFLGGSQPGGLGDRVVVVDETRYLTQTLRLGAQFSELILQGRAMGIPVVAASQRAAWVPRETWSEATHIFMFGSRDRRDLLTLRELGGRVDPDQIITGVMALERFEFLYVNRISGRLAISSAPQV
jgi:hypothetical protein